LSANEIQIVLRDIRLELQLASTEIVRRVIAVRSRLFQLLLAEESVEER
jgi:hypothetical protein